MWPIDCIAVLSNPISKRTIPPFLQVPSGFILRGCACQTLHTTHTLDVDILKMLRQLGSISGSGKKP